MHARKYGGNWLKPRALWLASAAWHGVSLAITIFALTACNFATSPTPTPEPKGGGGEFRVALAIEPASLNPNLRIDDPAFYLCQNLYNRLVALDVEYRVIPDLATRWEVSADGLTYTFYLAKNIRWHDGQLFTPDDVKWTFETIARQKGISQDLANRIASIESAEADTVVFRLKEPYAPFLPLLGWYGTFILPKHIYEGSDWTTHPANQKPIGTGPFKFVEWEKGDHITAEANRDYFKRGPFLDRVTWRFASSSAPAFDMVAKGIVDYSTTSPPRERVAELQTTPGVQVKTFPSTNRYYLGFNLRRKPLDDIRVRKAINMALDRSAILNLAFAGLGTPGVGFYTPGIPWAYNPKAQVPAFDPTGAEKLLDEAGVTRGSAGIRVQLTLVTSNISPFKETAQIVQEQLRAVGIEVDIALVTAADHDKRVYQEHDFDLWLVDGSHGPDPANLATRFGSKGQAPTGYKSDEFDAALEEGGRQANLEDRARAYFRAQEILARDLPLAPLVDPAFIVLARDNVTGLGYTEARGLVTFQDYSLVRLKSR